MSAPASRRSASVNAPGGVSGDGVGRVACGVAKRVRSAASATDKTESSDRFIGRLEPIYKKTQFPSDRFRIAVLHAFEMLCCSRATKRRAQPTFQAICFALAERLWCNSVNFPKGGWPGVRWVHRSASHGEPF